MLTYGQVQQTYGRIRKDIGRAMARRRYDRAIELLDAFAEVARRFNDVMTDNGLECVLSDLAGRLPAGCGDSGPISSREMVFYDQIGTVDCLAVQYLRALRQLGYQVHYLFESAVASPSPRLKEELERLGIQGTFFPNHRNRASMTLAAEIRGVLEKFPCRQMLIHSPAGGALGNVVIGSLKDWERIRIVPGDHHFYLGVSCTDRFLEFRDYGLRTAVMRRLIGSEKVFLLPYYPIVGGRNNFQGFPQMAGDKLKILAAGAEYKFFGSEVFFEVVDYILSHYPEAVILFCSRPTVRMQSMVEARAYGDRFVFLGYRNDFNECVRHCDILLSSYPMLGGLISQYAAYYERPVLACREAADTASDAELAGILGADGKNVHCVRVFPGEAEAYIDRLMLDPDFRQEEGRALKRLLPDEESFVRALSDILEHRAEAAGLRYRCPDSPEPNDAFVLKRNLAVQNQLQPDILVPVSNAYGLSMVWKFPFLSSIFRHQPGYTLKRMAICYYHRLLRK